MLIKTLFFSFLLLLSFQSLAREASFSGSLLTLDAVKVGNDTYRVELEVVPEASTLTFAVTSAVKVAASGSHIAEFVNGSLSIADVLVNGTRRFSAQFALVGQGALQFELRNAALLGSVTLENTGSVRPGTLLSVAYKGSVLNPATVAASAGGAAWESSVVDDRISVVVPVNASGNVVLDLAAGAARFRLPLAIEPVPAIANARTYVTGFVDDLESELVQSGLSADLIDRAGLMTALASLTEAEVRQLAYLIRENFEGLLEPDYTMRAMHALTLSGTNTSYMNALSDCESHALKYAAAKVAVAAGIGAGVMFAIPKPDVAALAFVVVGVGIKKALQYQEQVLDCREIVDITDLRQIYEQKTVTYAATVDVLENRPLTVAMTELHQIADSGIRANVVTVSRELKALIATARSTVAGSGFFGAAKIVAFLDEAAAAIVVDDRFAIDDNAHNYTIRSISDARISGTAAPAAAGGLTLQFDYRNGELAADQSVQFSVELYNARDDVVLVVPVRMKGLSMLDELTRAALGLWTVTQYGGDGKPNLVIDIELRAGGRGAYLLPLVPDDVQSGEGAPCVKRGYPPGMSGIQVGRNCEYRLTWSIAKKGEAYELIESDLWLHDFSVTRTPISLPLTGFSLYVNGGLNRTYVKK